MVCERNQEIEYSAFQFMMKCIPRGGCKKKKRKYEIIKKERKKVLRRGSNCHCFRCIDHKTGRRRHGSGSGLLNKKKKRKEKVIALLFRMIKLLDV